MTSTRGDLFATRKGRAAVGAAVALSFLALRIALIAGRQPFFDELFTLWLAPQPLPAIVRALRLDSGPPLYYFLLHPLLAAWRSVAVARAASLLFALVAFGVVLLRAELGPARFVAAALLAVHPAALFSAADARAYSLCAAGVTIGLVALDAWMGSASRRALAIAAVAFAAAAWSHYYGVLFLPLPLVAALVGRGDRTSAALPRSWRDGLLASVAGGLLFAPAFWLFALRQPREATSWFGSSDAGWLEPLRNATVAGRYPAALLAPAPEVLVAVASVAALVTIFWTRSTRARVFAAATLLPIALALVFRMAGRPVYYPLRFEAVTAVPFALWMAAALDTCPRRLWRGALFATLFAAGLLSSWIGVFGQTESPADEYRRAARLARATTPALVVASGYCYLEVLSQFSPKWHPSLAAMPPGQGAHPGWRAVATIAEIDAEVETFPQTFLWVGERRTPERSAVARRYRLEPILVLDRVEVAIAVRRK